jgi:alpha-ribazole phosphatase/probable phosphoglycerate mutase
MTTILFARHGETDWNVQRRVQGHSDTPLNETGRAQARVLADELAEESIDAVYSSDLLRAHETARIVAEPRGLNVTATRDLRERDFGTWEGLTDDEIFARYPEAASSRWGDGETKEEMAQRVFDALQRIADAHAGGRVLVVSHGGPLRAVLGRCGVDGIGRIENCHVVRVEAGDGLLRRVD